MYVKMAAAIVLGFFLTVVAVGALKVAHNTTTTLTCRGRMSFPAWYLNGSLVPPGPLYQFEQDPITGDLMSILVIDGNNTCSTLDLKCTVETSTTFAIRLTVQGALPSPENVTISSQNFFATQVQWKHPYYMMNQYSDVVHVDPHITHYTVYTIDAYTRRIIETVNTTETNLTSRHNVPLCPMYQVSAWNAGGEGELSELAQDSTPQVPRSITAERITVTIEHSIISLHISIDVDVACTNRIPEFFFITLMNSGGNILEELNMSHESGQAVADFTISVPQTVDVCSLHVRISGGNSAGVSAPCTAVVVVCSGDSTDSTTTASTTASTTAVTSASSSSSVSEGNSQQENSTTLIVILIGIITAICGVWVAAVTIGIIYCRGHRKDKVKKTEIEMKPNKAYETVIRLQPATQVHTKPCPAYEVVVQAHH